MNPFHNTVHRLIRTWGIFFMHLNDLNNWTG